MRSVAALFVLWLFLPLAQANTQTSDKTLRIGLVGTIASLNPLVAEDDTSLYALGFVRRPITVFDANWHLVCMLCVTLPTLENGLAVRQGDGLAVTVTLHDKAVWGDGTPISSNDVVFSWRVARHFDRVSLPIDTITVVDSKTFTIQYSALDYRYNWLHLLTLLPAHVEGSVFANAPNEWVQRTRYEQNKLDPGLYNGAYRIAEQGSTMLQLDRNVAWWGQVPYFQRIILKTYTTSDAVLNAFTKGDIDMVAGQARLPLSTSIPESHRRLITVNQFFEHMDINVEHPALQDVRVRQALLYGIDRDALNTITYDGQYHVAASLLHPLDGMLSRDIAQYDYNPTKASVLLDEAGWMRGADGRRAKAGQFLQITFTTTADDSARALIQQTVQYYWRQLGVDVTVEVHAPDVFFSDILPKRAFSGVALYAWTASPESVPVTMLHSTHIPSAENGWRGQNYGGYRDERIDATLNQLVQSVDTPVKQELWQNVQERYMASLPSLPLFFMADMDIVPFELRGYQPTGHDYPPSLWSEFWLKARDEAP